MGRVFFEPINPMVQVKIVSFLKQKSKLTFVLFMEHLIFHVLFQCKGKGILVFPILIACVLVMLFLAGFIIEEVLVWKGIDRLYYVGIGFWLAGAWLWFIKDSFYINEYGEKVLIDEMENSFWFLPMSYWSRIFGVIGALVMLAPFA